MILKKHHYTLLYIAVLVLAFVLRIYHLGKESIWLDEGISVAMSKLDFSAMLDKSVLDTSPPLYYLLLHYWMLCFSDSEFSIRFLSLLFGVASIALTYEMVKFLFNEKIALLSTFLLSVSVFHVEFSQEARCYSMITFLSVASFYFLLNWKEKRSALFLLLLFITNLLFLYTHILAVFFIVAQNVYFLSLKDKGAINIKSWFILQFLLLAAFAPWIKMFLSQASAWHSTNWMQAPNTKDLLGTFTTYSGSVLLCLVFVVLIIKALLNYKLEKEKFYFLLSWFALPTLLLVMFCFVFNSIYLQKYTIASSVPFFILVARGIQTFEQKKHKIFLLSIIVVLAAIKLVVYYVEDRKEQWRDVVAVVENNAAKDDVILFDAAYCKHNSFDYYARRTDLNKLPLIDVREEVNVKNVLRLDTLSNDAKSTWLVLSHTRDAKGLVKKKIKTDYDILFHQEYVGVEVYRLRKK